MVELPESDFVDYLPEDAGDEAVAAPSPDEVSGTIDAFVIELLGKEGKLRASAAHGGRPYEFRPQQLAMARQIAACLAHKSNLCIEAPTGIGKSFAYLVPAIRFAVISRKPVVVTTETINLQEQLIEKDLPLLKKISGVDFTASLAKGRGNYLCLRRLQLLTDDRKEKLLPSRASKFDLDEIAEWSKDTPDGDPDNGNLPVDPATWSLVCSESGNCMGSRCTHFRRCFYFKARQNWEKADVIVANHALFLTDLKLRRNEELSSSLLPNYSAVIVDEAHTLEDSAADHLGLAVSQIGMLAWLNRLFSPDAARGLLMHKGEKELELRGMVAELRGEVRSFFRVFAEFISAGQDSVRRVRTPNAFPDNITAPLAKLRSALRDLTLDLEDDEQEKDYRCEIESHILRCDGYIDAVGDFIAMTMPEAVYWAEESHDAVVLQAAPVNVGKLLKETLFDLPMPVVLTSATLTVEKSFSFYLRRIGFDNGQTLQLDSPFDPAKVKLLLPRTMPEPTADGYIEELQNKIAAAVRRTNGKAFVLFTSYSLMRDCAERMRPFFADEELTLLVQGDDLRRTAMLKKFREDVNSVLFGVDSFWTGVDVPGEALSNVIVTRLPFQVPSHPLIQARCELIESRGESSFMNYSLPTAVLKLRQGVGRLIRSSSDTGEIVLLDSRITTKRYGKTFLNSLPKYPTEYF